MGSVYWYTLCWGKLFDDLLSLLLLRPAYGFGRGGGSIKQINDTHTVYRIFGLFSFKQKIITHKFLYRII